MAKHETEGQYDFTGLLLTDFIYKLKIFKFLNTNW